MAKVRAPFFSLGAHGTVGQALTVSRHKGLHVAKKIPLHPDARTAAQLAQRSLYSHARDLWLTLTETEKATLLAEGRPLHMTGFNLLLRRYLTDLLDLEAWWPLNDGAAATAQDYSLHRTHGTVFGCIPAVDFCGQDNNAFFFDGVNDRVVATAPQLNFTSTDFSLTARLYITDLNVWQVILTRGLSNADGWFVAYNNARMLRFGTSQGGVDQSTDSANGALPLTTWITVGFSRQGTTGRVYLNGADITAVPGVHLNPLTSARTVKIGIHDDEAQSQLWGRLCDVKVYSRFLTTAQHLATHQRYCVHPPR